MGLLVDIAKKYNETRADIKDAYIRIETYQVWPKFHTMRLNVSGYVNKESGYRMKEKEIAEVKEVEEFFFANECLNGETVATMGRGEIIPPEQTINEPIVIFREYYTLRFLNKDGTFKDEYKNLKITDYEALHRLAYDKLKQFEPRFTNVRNVIDDPKIV